MTGAERAAHQANWAAVLRHLLAVWAKVLDPALADVIERVGKHLSPQPLAWFKGRTGRMLAWTQRLHAEDAADLPLLLRSLCEGTAADTQARAELLAVHAPDPRIPQAVLGLLDDPPFRSSTTLRAWRALFHLLVVHPDPRSLARLQAFDPTPHDFSPTVTMAFLRYQRRTLDQLQRTLHDRVQSLSTQRRHMLDTIDALLQAAHPDQRMVQTFEADVWADPADMDARAVLADALLRQGDPRGEFISLQLARGPLHRASDRERALQAAHQAEWLGPLGDVLTDARFENGFLAAGRLKPGAQFDAVIDNPRWTTLRALDCRDHRAAARFVGTSACAQVRMFESVTMTDMDAIIRAGHPVESLSVLGPEHARQWRGLMRLKALTTLRRLRLYGGCSGWAYGFSTPGEHLNAQAPAALDPVTCAEAITSLPHLTEVEMAVGITRLGDWLRAFEQTGPRVVVLTSRRHTNRHTGWYLHLTRSPHGWACAARYTVQATDRRRRPPIHPLTAALEGLGTVRLAHLAITVHATRARQADPAAVLRLENALVQCRQVQTQHPFICAR